MKQIKHAARMCMRNLRSYGMLSVTIVLSFSLLLGYLAFMDSDLYNKYKHIMAQDSKLLLTFSYDYSNHYALQNVVENTDPDATVYTYYTYDAILSQYGTVYAKVSFLPRSDSPIYTYTNVMGDRYHNTYSYGEPLEIIRGKQTFLLEANEAIVDETLFRAISPDGTLPVSLTIPVLWKDQTYSYYTVNVVGVCSLKGNLRETDNGIKGSTYIYVSQYLLGEHSVNDFDVVKWTSQVYTQYPSTIEAYIRSLDFNIVCSDIHDEQEQAILDTQAKTSTKGAVAAILLLLLGINLYSSFSNALNNRKFEIGIKRAIGASPGHILSQFLLESLFVMLINILISVLLVTDVLVLYKLYLRITEEYTWIVRISSYSAGMFLLCSVTLTIVFSMMFAYKSTQVQIVDYLKAE